MGEVKESKSFPLRLLQSLTQQREVTVGSALGVLSNGWNSRGRPQGQLDARFFGARLSDGDIK